MDKTPRGLLCDRAIMDLCLWKGMINPFTFGDGVDHEVPWAGPALSAPLPPANLKKEKGKISGGLSSYGYDIRVGGSFKVFTNSHGNVIIDPKNFDPRSFVDRVVTREQPQLVIPPHSFVLAESLEYFTMPENVLAICLGRSTYCRCGIGLDVSPAEPGWLGKLTIEIRNNTPLPAIVYAFEGIAQLVFFEGERCMFSYKEKKGRYQNQQGITLPFVS